MSPWKSGWSLALVLGLCSLIGENANAGVLKFENEITVLAGSSVGVGLFSKDTAVKFTGLFDPAISIDDGTSAFTPFTSLEIEIDGLGVYHADVPSNFGVFSADPSWIGLPGIGIAEKAFSGAYISFFDTTTQPYAYNSLAPNEFVNFSSTFTAPLTIALAGGAGDFTFDVSLLVPTTATISTLTVVPEPTSMTIIGLGSLLVMARRSRRARK
jgi:hypothetical protein